MTKRRIRLNRLGLPARGEPPERMDETMDKKWMIWAGLFLLGLLTVLCRMELSRYLSDASALLVGGGILAAVSGAGLLLELYRRRR